MWTGEIVKIITGYIETTTVYTQPMGGQAGFIYGDKALDVNITGRVFTLGFNNYGPYQILVHGYPPVAGGLSPSYGDGIYVMYDSSGVIRAATNYNVCPLSVPFLLTGNQQYCPSSTGLESILPSALSVYAAF